MKSLITAACILLSLTAVSPVTAQNYPEKPIRMVVPYPAGQGTDVLCRAIAEQLTERLGQPVVVDNRPGAGGNIGTDIVAKARPDGYTILGGTNATHGMNAALYSKMPFNHVTDFSPIILLDTVPMVLVANPSVSANLVKDVIDLAKAKPGAINFGASSTTSRVSAELLKRMASIDVVAVPYKGTAAMFTDLIAGRIQFGFETMAAATPQIANNRLKAIAVTSAKRTELAPNIPTVAELDLPGYEVVGWSALFAPAGTPPAIVRRLNSEVGKILETPQVKQRMVSLGFNSGGGSPEDLGARVKSDTEKWGQIIKAAGIRAD